MIHPQALLIAVLTLLHSTLCTALPMLSFSPASPVNVSANQPFSLDVLISGLAGQVVSAYDVDVLYPSALLIPTGIVFDGFLGDASLFQVLESPSGGSTAPGVVDFAALSLLSDVELLPLQAPNSGFRLATLNFLGIADGAATFQFAFGPGNDVKCDNNSVCIPAIPEPEIYLMLLVGLGLIGWAWRWRAKAEPVAGCPTLPDRSAGRLS